MKRLFLTVVAALTLTATFAKDEKANNVNNANASCFPRFLVM